MGRPIEFRAWDTELKQYVEYTDDLCISLSGKINTIDYSLGDGYTRIADECEEDRYIIEQFTGPYDATTWQELTEEEREEWTRRGNMPSEWKGRKIFEGDRVSFNGNITADDSMGFEPNGYMYDETNVHTVVWDKNLLAWNLDFEDDEEMKYKRDTRALLLAGRCKVIGHIHEVSK